MSMLRLLGPALSLSALCAPTLAAQGTPQPGVHVLQPMGSTTAYVVDLAGNVINSWPGDARPGLAVYMAPNGDLVRTRNIAQGPGGGGGGGAIERRSWDGQLVWSFTYTGPSMHSHHDIALLPNGNVLMIAWDSVGRAGGIAAGRDPNTLDNQFWSDHIIEIEPDGSGSATVVWEWYAADHLVQNRDPNLPNFGTPADHPERIDVNFPVGNVGTSGDWLHCNGIDYNEELDQIVISSRTFSEIWVIDHSTTTAEAAGSTGGNSGRGGDLLYRWGNPRAYGRGGAADQQLFGQHDPQWIEDGRPGAGNLLVFNNGTGRPAGPFSSADEIVPPLNGQGTYDVDPVLAYGPTAPVSVSTHPTPTVFYSTTTSGCQRLPNGNTLMVEGDSGLFIEIDPAGQLVWSWANSLPGNARTFKSRRHPGGVTGLAFCDPAVVNSTGSPGVLKAVGSTVAGENALTLALEQLPPQQFGMVVNSMTSGFAPGAGGSMGNLCVSGDIGRHSRLDEIIAASATGTAFLTLDLTDLPTPAARVAVQAGETWYFQCWFRDVVGGMNTSNFTNGVEVSFF